MDQMVTEQQTEFSLATTQRAPTLRTSMTEIGLPREQQVNWELRL
jgi:hypothetical protein